jgi:2-polyprenyl-3-methyl-5-hydroxy-6-metoxy-1,4-benzoquinol methylase
MNREPQDLFDPYRLDGSTGVMTPPVPVAHRDDDYDTQGHESLLAMQRGHFWYRGRHRFLFHAVRRWALPRYPRVSRPRVIDIGGGCGGWIRYLADRAIWPGAELALSDSSIHALRLAKPFLPEGVGLYQADLLNLQWRDRWDCVLLLDVLEHIADHQAALRQVHQATAPDGLLFVTVPALKFFWSFVDEAGHHQRRYARSDFSQLAASTGWTLLDCRYFMFVLSPLFWISRILNQRKVLKLTSEERLRLAQRGDATPGWLVNELLAAVFAAETPMGHQLSFPWGTSLLAVLERRTV